MEQSELYKRYVSEAVLDNPAPDADGGAAAAPGSDGGDSGDAAGPAVTLTADAVAAEVLRLFRHAKGMSLSVLIASRLQELRGRHMHDFAGSDDE
jgi:hypothetical protein